MSRNGAGFYQPPPPAAAGRVPSVPNLSAPTAADFNKPLPPRVGGTATLHLGGRFQRQQPKKYAQPGAACGRDLEAAAPGRQPTRQPSDGGRQPWSKRTKIAVVRSHGASQCMRGAMQGLRSALAELHALHVANCAARPRLPASLPPWSAGGLGGAAGGCGRHRHCDRSDAGLQEQEQQRRDCAGGRGAGPLASTTTPQPAAPGCTPAAATASRQQPTTAAASPLPATGALSSAALAAAASPLAAPGAVSPTAALAVTIAIAAAGLALALTVTLTIALASPAGAAGLGPRGQRGAVFRRLWRRRRAGRLQMER